MSELFKNKYRVSSARLQNWDYGWNGAYFITICTKDREFLFGDIENGAMKLSGTGIIANILWHEIKNHATGVELGEFIVMPNHVHGIIIINADDDLNAATGHAVETGHALSLRPQSQSQPPSLQTGHAVETGHALSLPTPGQQRFRNQGKNTLSSIVGGYKSAVTKHANRLKYLAGWQTRFHEHIIRDEQSFQNISNYIQNNPANWGQDKFFRLP